MVNFPGLTVSVPLFFSTDESIDFKTLGRYLEDVCKNEHIYAVYAMAFNTRYRVLDTEDVLAVNRFICKTVKGFGKQVFVGHPLQVSKSELFSYLEKIASVSPDGISMLYPERFFGQCEPIIDFVSSPKKFDLDVVLHEAKLVSGFDGSLINWPHSLIEHVLTAVKLRALKEDSTDDMLSNFIFDQSLLHDFMFILAGGGKQRLGSFLDRGIQTWLNGSTVFLPGLVDKAYLGFVSRDTAFIDFYLRKIEKPFFSECVSKFGWHLAHKAALSFFGYGQPVERFPHAKVTPDIMRQVSEPLSKIAHAVEELEV